MSLNVLYPCKIFLRRHIWKHCTRVKWSCLSKVVWYRAGRHVGWPVNVSLMLRFAVYLGQDPFKTMKVQHMNKHHIYIYIYIYVQIFCRLAHIALQLLSIFENSQSRNQHFQITGTRNKHTEQKLIRDKGKSSEIVIKKQLAEIHMRQAKIWIIGHQYFTLYGRRKCDEGADSDMMSNFHLPKQCSLQKGIEWCRVLEG